MIKSSTLNFVRNPNPYHDVEGRFRSLGITHMNDEIVGNDAAGWVRESYWHEELHPEVPVSVSLTTISTPG